jgi:hypothetical protein
MKRSLLRDLSVDQLIDLFANIAIAQDEALLADRIAEYNRFYSQQDAIEEELRRRGRDAAMGLVRFYDHPNVQVRLVSAQRTRDLAPALARKVFETIVKSQHFPQAASAATSLRNLEHGISRPMRTRPVRSLRSV